MRRGLWHCSIVVVYEQTCETFVSLAVQSQPANQSLHSRVCSLLPGAAYKATWAERLAAFQLDSWAIRCPRYCRGAPEGASLQEMQQPPLPYRFQIAQRRESSDGLCCTHPKTMQVTPAVAPSVSPVSSPLLQHLDLLPPVNPQFYCVCIAPCKSFGHWVSL